MGETLSAHLDIVQNGGGAVPQLYTRALTKSNMTPNQLVPPRRPSRRLSSQRSRSPLKRRLLRNQRLLSRSQRSRSPLKRRPPRRLSRRLPRRLSSQRSRSLLKRRPPRRLSRRLLLSAIFQRTEDADQNTETLSAHLDIVQNGGGAVPQLYTRALTKSNMTPNQLVLPRRPSRRLSRSQRSRSLLRRRSPLRRPPRRLSRRLPRRSRSLLK